MKTIGEILAHCHRYLEDRGVSRPKREAEELLSDALAMKRIELFMQLDRPLMESELEVCRQRLVRRGKGEPLAYIQGNVEVYGCRIVVTPDVLIPRQETELLIDKVVKSLEGRKQDPLVVWDLCCGSGVIGIALKKKFPAYTVVLSDLSEKALAVANRNAHGNAADVELRQGDLLVPFMGEKADVVVCNPPYVSEEEYLHLEREVRDFEPKMALLGGVDGLSFYRRLAQELPGFLNPGAKVWFEIGHGQGAAMLNLFQGGYWTRAQVQRDYSGKERFFSLETE